MEMTVLGYHNKKYLAQVYRWAKRLEAEDITVHYDHSVTLTCKYGYICYRYKPSAKELI